MSEHPEAIGYAKIPVGISSCLLGNRVRYDGGHRAHSYIIETLGEYFEFREFCPEIEIGMGVPRKPLRLSRIDSDEIRCWSVEDATKDFTDELQQCADDQQRWHEKLCGYILKKDSPSCGMQRVEVWNDEMPARDGIGIYAAKMMQNYPCLPVVEEGALGDAVSRENFMQRVFALRRWYEMVESGLCVDHLVDFHARHLLIIMSHDRYSSRTLGRLVAATSNDNLEENTRDYLCQFMQVLKIHATRSNHLHVLQQLQGYLTSSLNDADNQELAQSLERYSIGQLPLGIAIGLFNRLLGKHPNEHICNAWYLNPYPSELSTSTQAKL